MEKSGFGEKAVIKAPGTTLGGAIMKISAGKQTDTIFHRTHGKIVYVLSGKLRATVMRDGQISNATVTAGTSFFVTPGLVHHLHGIEDTVVIEFASSEMYDGDTYCIFKGTTPAPAPQEKAKVDDIMKVPVETKVDGPVESPKKTTKSKTRKAKK